MAQFTVIIEVLVAQGKGIDSLFEQFQQRVVATCLTPSIGDRPGNGLGQPHLFVDPGQERNTAIAGDVAAAEVGFNFAAFNRWKFDQSLVAFCHGGIVPEYLFRNYILRGLNDSVVLFSELSGLSMAENSQEIQHDCIYRRDTLHSGRKALARCVD